MIYLHIPFCQRRCIYCDFYSTTCNSDVRHRFVRALCAELESRCNYLPSRLISTLYLGGGTPSQLTPAELADIVQTVHRTYEVDPQAELTFEANPDDVTPELVDALVEMGFNRVSLGVQTFRDDLLGVLHRRHTAAEAEQAVHTLVQGGISNVSIDLIYGLPLQTVADFEADLQRAFALPVKHLSAYALTVEPNTMMGRKVAAGELTPADEDTCADEFECLQRAAQQAGFEQYEISNFSLPGYHSRHNSGYWDGTPYLGCGPGAHSFDGTNRQQNLSDLKAYLQTPGEAPHIIETLSAEERFDELIFLSLRTRRGLHLDTVAQRFGEGWYADLLHAAAPHIDSGQLITSDGFLRIAPEAIFVSDDLMTDLMRG